MLFVHEGTLDEIMPPNFIACDECGRKYTGSIAATHKCTGENMVFQYEHFDFHKVAENVLAFAFYLDSVQCQRCERRLYEDTDVSLEIVAGRMLRFYPEADSITATCPNCVADERSGDED